MGDKVDRQFERIGAVLGDDAEQDLSTSVQTFFEHLQRSLTLPCEVTGVEDFRWEEYYVLGPGSQKEYARLRQEQPSYRDRFDLFKIELGPISEWMLFGGEDIAAYVRRKSDKKEFILGLAELKAVDKKSSNYQLLDDFGVFLVNNR